MVKAGHNIDIKPKKPTSKLLSMLTKLNDLPQEAEKELKNIQDLQKEVNRLKHELSKATKPGVSLPVANNANQNKKLEETNRALQIRNGELVAQLKEKEKELLFWKSVGRGVILNKIHSLAVVEDSEYANKETNFALDVKNLSNKDKDFSLKTKRIDIPVDIPKNGVSKYASTGNGTLGKCSREIIKFLAQYSEREFSKAQTAIATGYSAGSGGFNNSISELNQKGFILRSTGKLQVNPDAMSDIIDSIGSITTQQYNIETYKNNLGACERKIYETILKSPQYWYSKQELAEETGYSADSGGFNNSISRLNTLELIERRTGQIRLNQELLELI